MASDATAPVISKIRTNSWYFEIYFEQYILKHISNLYFSYLNMLRMDVSVWKSISMTAVTWM